MLYVFFWVILRASEFHTPTFRNTLSVPSSAYKDGTECSETSAYEIQTPGNYPEENMHLKFILFWNNTLQNMYDMYLMLHAQS